MRLLKIDDNDEFSLVEHFGAAIPPYAILSHTWGPPTEEVSCKDLMEDTGHEKSGFAKLAFCAKMAAYNGLQHFWADVACIDKSSSAELSEAINSMFRWYKEAARCYVYMSDVTMDPFNIHSARERRTGGFRESRWFTRGWTLQELIAPASVYFYSREEHLLGTRSSLNHEIHEVTGIPLKVLQERSMDGFTADERLSWALGRETTREEDMAYALLGLMDIHMPLIYGEGRTKAFNRMLKEITEELMTNKSNTDSSCVVS